MQFRSCLQRLCAVAAVLRFPEGNQVRVCDTPSEMKAKCSWEAVDTGTEQTRIGQTHDGRMCTSCRVDRVSNSKSGRDWD